ncbi:dipeptidase [bacterium]|nr:MAG: dipeptidase [bacterium]
MEKILKALKDSEAETFSGLFEFLRFPSVSADPQSAGDVRRCAEWLAEKMKMDGFAASVEETGGHPAVLGRWDKNPGAPTVLIYGHYDVQPAVKSDGWNHEPFTPVIDGEKLYCRGSSDDKGQFWCHYAAAKAHLKAYGKLPVNVIFLVEGEEEANTGKFDNYVRESAKKLACDAVIVSDGPMYGDGFPALTYSLRGLAYMEFTVTGPDRDLHSGVMGGIVMNPAQALAKMITSLKDEEGRIMVEGFFDGVAPVAQWERDNWKKLPFDEAASAKEIGVETLAGEVGYTWLERLWARPTLDVNGMWSGYIGEGSKTIIPSAASAKISCRLVPGQDPDRIAELLEAKMRSVMPKGVTMTAKMLAKAQPVLLPYSGPAVEGALAAMEAAYGREPFRIREGATIPVVHTLAESLGAPVVLAGLGRVSDRIHGPDEHFRLEDLRSGMEFSARLLTELAGRL